MFRTRRSYRNRRRFRSKKRYLRRRYRKTGRYIRLARAVKRIVNSQKETHYFIREWDNVQLYHNAANTSIFDPWSAISVGDRYDQRTGDEIQMVGMKFKFWIANKLDRPNVMYRIIAGWCPRSINGGVITAVNVWNYILEVPSGGTLVNSMIATRANRYGIRYVIDKVYNLQVGSSTTTTLDKECHMRKSFYIRPKYKKMRFNGAFAQGKVFFIGLIAYDSRGTLTTDNIASYSLMEKVFWKDD